ncbi:hypothetical protein F4678DRAFT_230529 [Xylaria arbuscula]|nr:hypothetical protein F4678DRAFT_230529 [Xylaria arbuscula]
MSPRYDFFWVSTKPRRSRENHSNQENKEHVEKAAIRIEARPRTGSAKGKKQGGKLRKKLLQKSGTMTHPHTGPDLAARREQLCPCVSCRSQLSRQVAHISHGHDEPNVNQHSPQGPASGNLPHSPPIHQIYVYPHSTYHYRFPVVDHSRNITSFPVCYTALVPEAAAVRDIVATLINRPGMVAMVRLSATEELVRIDTFQFHCIRALSDASMQLEIWESTNVINN